MCYLARTHVAPKILYSWWTRTSVSRSEKRQKLQSAKNMYRQNQELQTECWIEGKCCKHWQVIFWGYRCICWFWRFCTATVKKKKHSSVKEQNILLLLSNESSTFQRGNFSVFRNVVFQESRTYSTPAGRYFHPKCLAVLFASERAEPKTSFWLIELKICTTNKPKYTRIN